ncbi:MAG: metallophosphoesterase, partial [Chlamydiia bacterium]|nr:metallophosphoesterase [Chlamydiia bacterium]
LLLDTNHFSPIEGAQTTWLNSTLSEYAHLPFKSAHYHVAAYPSYASYHGVRATAIRTNWVPLFEQYKLTTGFENHNHTYKRTYPLLGSQPHPNGIVYLGDGSWGVPPRYPYSAPYLAKTASINAFYLITLYPTDTAIESYDINGNLVEKIKP